MPKPESKSDIFCMRMYINYHIQITEYYFFENEILFNTKKKKKELLSNEKTWEKQTHTTKMGSQYEEFPHCVITIYETIETVKISLRKGTGGLTCNTEDLKGQLSLFKSF